MKYIFVFILALSIKIGLAQGILNEMTEGLVYAQATVTAKAGMTDSLKIHLMENAMQARSEKGCVFYEVFRDTRDPNVFVLFENWADQESISRHIEMPYIRKWFSIRERFIDKSTLTIMTKITGQK